jgi:hypothetical protein
MEKNKIKITKTDLRKIINEVLDEFAHNFADRPKMMVKVKSNTLGKNLLSPQFPVYVENGDWYFATPYVAIRKDAVEIIGEHEQLPDNFED